MSRTRGFTLAEIVVAIGVLALLSLFLIGLVTTNLGLQGKGEQNIAAVHVAEGELDRWKSRPYGEVLDLVGQNLPKKLHTSDSYEFTTTLKVTRLEPPALNPDGSLLKLSVTTQWTERTTLSSDFTLTQRSSSLLAESVVSPGSSL